MLSSELGGFITCIFLWCFITSSVTSEDIETPNEEKSEFEKYLARELQNSIDYTVNVFFHGPFSHQKYELDKPRTIQVNKINFLR